MRLKILESTENKWFNYRIKGLSFPYHTTGKATAVMCLFLLNNLQACAGNAFDPKI